MLPTHGIGPEVWGSDINPYISLCETKDPCQHKTDDDDTLIFIHWIWILFKFQIDLCEGENNLIKNE